MLSKNRIKQINSLQIKKYRQESGTFVAEGTKVVLELLRSEMRIKEIFAVPEWILSYADRFKNTIITAVNAVEIRKLSAMTTACSVVAEVYIPKPASKPGIRKCELCLALDGVRDPGNLGTILRIANWYGISTVLASNDCTDMYNPKVVQASMGSAFRVRVDYCDLPKMLSEASSMGIDVFGTFMDGESIYSTDLSKGGVIVMGNEGHGISSEVSAAISRRIAIPCGCDSASAPESLNVSSATAIVCNEFYRVLNQKNSLVSC
ncbi:MAG: RNA methyltransferase [Bacteroidales bacterium]|nr:RNA methyltransferase [Bacteroidales bacterium]